MVRKLNILLILALAVFGCGPSPVEKSGSKKSADKAFALEEGAEIGKMFNDYLSRAEEFSRNVEEKEDALSRLERKKWIGDMGADIDINRTLNLYFYSPVREDIKFIKDLYAKFKTTSLVKEDDLRAQIYRKNINLIDCFWKAVVVEKSVLVYNQAGKPFLERISVLREEHKAKQRPLENKFGKNEISFKELCGSVRALYNIYRAKEIAAYYKHVKVYHGIMRDFFTEEKESEGQVLSFVNSAKSQKLPDAFIRELKVASGKLKQFTDNNALSYFGFGLFLAPEIIYGWNECHANIALPKAIKYHRDNPLVYEDFAKAYGQGIQNHVVQLAQAYWESLTKEQQDAFMNSIKSCESARDHIVSAAQNLSSAGQGAIKEALINFPQAAENIIDSAIEANKVIGNNAEAYNILSGAKTLLPLDDIKDRVLDFEVERVDSGLITFMHTTTGVLKKANIALDIINKGISEELRPADLLDLTDFVGDAAPVFSQIPGEFLKNHLKYNVQEGGDIVTSGLDIVEGVLQDGYTQKNRERIKQLDSRVSTYRADFAANFFGGRPAVEALRKGAQYLENSANYVKGIWNSIFK